MTDALWNTITHNSKQSSTVWTFAVPESSFLGHQWSTIFKMYLLKSYVLLVGLSRSKSLKTTSRKKLTSLFTIRRKRDSNYGATLHIKINVPHLLGSHTNLYKHEHNCICQNQCVWCSTGIVSMTYNIGKNDYQIILCVGCLQVLANVETNWSF